MSFNSFNFRIIICFAILIEIQEVLSQRNYSVIRSCNDAVIRDHLHKWNHSYCYHACGLVGSDISSSNDPTQCTADGDCLCEYKCSNNDTLLHQSFSYDEKLCNPPRYINYPTSDPSDPDPQAHPQCISRCATKCFGGSGAICGETEELKDSNNQEITAYAKICTCFCPVQRCPIMPQNNTTIINNNLNQTTLVVIAVSNTTNITNNNTTTIQVTPSMSTISIQELVALVISKLLAMYFLILKVYGVWAVQAIFLSIFPSLFYGFVSFFQLV